MSVAEEADMPLNGSKDITLAVSISELEHMSTSEVMCDQDIARGGRGGTGHKVVMGVYERGRDIYCRGGSGRRTRMRSISADVCQGDARGEGGII